MPKYTIKILKRHMKCGIFCPENQIYHIPSGVPVCKVIAVFFFFLRKPPRGIILFQESVFAALGRGII